ncbi:hypothetical protein FDP41_008673 [Naegleria fowleri]|uniref:Uncharacterized protein n=1 Tax=Naegleria fowleri TaxID=5763 RepID=A0A6A5BIY9_NAEFO|nr:uncharacterized protein FDP41_008673 [Naegleria fowleri]KAF0973009.1 hypothetical protein FDP41_008673 [Naegleria fowleri]
MHQQAQHHHHHRHSHKNSTNSTTHNDLSNHHSPNQSISKGYSTLIGESHHPFQEPEGHQLGGVEGGWTFSSTTDPFNSTSAPSISIMEEDDNPFSLSVPFCSNEGNK